MRRIATGVLLLLVALSAGCGRDHDALGVEWYCGYGAESRAQFRACVKHVSWDDVGEALKKGSSAAEFANYCLTNHTDPDGSVGLIRECNSVRFD